MDVRAFGSIYGQTSSLPFTSGFGWVPAQGRVNFPACRALFVDAPGNQSKGYLSVEMSDAPGQTARAENLQGDTIYPFSCTALLSGSIGGVFVLY
jgi:hypothetical protein